MEKRRKGKTEECKTMTNPYNIYMIIYSDLESGFIQPETLLSSLSDYFLHY